MKRLLSALALLAGCHTVVPSTIVGIQSLEVTLTDPPPTALGTPGMPVLPAELTFDVRAVDAQGETFPADIDVHVFVSFAGNKIGKLTPCGDNEDTTPLTTLRLGGGVARAQKVSVPHAFGTVTLWLEEAPPGGTALSTGSRAVGASPPIYFPNPTVPELQTPLDASAPTATYCSSFAGKHVIIDHATGAGSLVVTSTFVDAYVVADTGAVYDPMTNTGGFNAMYIFTYSRPPAEIVPGRLLTSLSGNLSKFVGFTELNFPIARSSETVSPALLPPPYVLERSDRALHSKLIRLSASTVSLTGTACPIRPDDDRVWPQWLKYNEFPMNMGDGICSSLSTFQVTLPAKTLGGFDPVTDTRTVTIVGMLRNNSGQNEVSSPPIPCTVDANCAAAGFSSATCVQGSCKKNPYNFWSVNPRDLSDVSFP